MATVAISDETKIKLNNYSFEHKKKQIDVVTDAVERYMKIYKEVIK